MRNIITFCLALLCFAQTSCTPSNSSTIVYVVRHAEKVDNPADENPPLSRQGEERSKALAEYLEEEEIAALYATPYQRTSLTLLPLAEAKNLEVPTYEPHDFAAVTKSILDNDEGKTVVVSGHSNTILEILEAFGAKRPMDKLADHEYDYIFKLTLADGKEPEVEVGHYGAPNAVGLE